MPMIDLTMPEGALPDDKVPVLMNDLSTALMKWEGAPDNERTRSVTWAFVHRRGAGDLFVGGRPAMDKPYYKVDLTVPDKTLLRGNDERKAGLIGAVTKLVLTAEGSTADRENSARVWCLIHEIPDGNWGAFADQFTMRTILEYIGHTPVPRDKVKEIPLPSS